MTRGRAIAWAAAALALWAAAAAAAAIPAPVPGAGRDTLRVPATIRPAVVKLGERVRVRLAVPLPEPGARIIGPPASSSFGAVDVLASGPAEAGRDSAGWEMVVALFEPGDQDLTALPFALRSSTGERPLRLLAYTLSVETTIPDTAGDASLRDIRGPVKVPLRWRWGRVLALSAGIALAAAVLIFLRRRRSRMPAELAPLEPGVSPEEATLSALRDLEREALPARGLLKEHYFRLSLVLRGYVERRFALPAVESTTEEIREALEERRILAAPEQAEALALFEEADLVKFAKFNPGREAGEAALRRGRDWVERVAPRPGPGGEA